MKNSNKVIYYNDDLNKLDRSDGWTTYFVTKMNPDAEFGNVLDLFVTTFCLDPHSIDTSCIPFLHSMATMLP